MRERQAVIHSFAERVPFREGWGFLHTVNVFLAGHPDGRCLTSEKKQAAPCCGAACM